MDHKEALNVLIAHAICNDSSHFDGCFKCPLFGYAENDCFNTMNNGTVVEAVKFLQE